jgi:hypothetical protein
MDEITIGYLTWKKNDLINDTLKSHNDNGLFQIIKPENRYIFFQESNIEKDIELCKKYNCNYLGDENNIGILNAFVKLVENCKTKYFIFCENDFILLNSTNNYSLQNCFIDAMTILDNNKFAQIKLSNYKKPGFLYCTPQNKENWLLNKQENYPYKIESFSWILNPRNFYNCVNILTLNYDWLYVSSKHQKWSNHIYICNIYYLKNVVVPLLLHNKKYNEKLDIKYQGLEDTLNNVNDIPNKDKNIDELIKMHLERQIFTGGGNFFHNKKF